MSSFPADAVVLHATSVALGGRAALIRGPSGSGKSSLALQLIALGAGLVSDDRTMVQRADGALIVSAPDSIRGRIEARGVGILNAPAEANARAALIVDLPPETAPHVPPRLPPEETEQILGVALPLVRGVAAAHFTAALHLYLRHGRAA